MNVKGIYKWKSSNGKNIQVKRPLGYKIRLQKVQESKLGLNSSKEKMLSILDKMKKL
jgi:hypothetical protein